MEDDEAVRRCAQHFRRQLPSCRRPQERELREPKILVSNQHAHPKPHVHIPGAKKIHLTKAGRDLYYVLYSAGVFVANTCKHNTRTISLDRPVRRKKWFRVGPRKTSAAPSHPAGFRQSCSSQHSAERRCAAAHGVIGGTGRIRWGITAVIIFSTSLK